MVGGEGYVRGGEDGVGMSEVYEGGLVMEMVGARMGWTCWG